MGDSDGTWGDLASHDNGLAEVWDTYERLPEPGENEALDAFCARKGFSINALVRLGAKLSDDHVLAFGFTGGIKFRDIVTDKRWSYFGSEWPELKVVRHGTTPSDKVIVVEGETDGANLTERVADADVAIMPAGAKYFPQEYADQLADYEMVLVGLDDDAAGELGFEKISERMTQAVRFLPPGGDWCDTETLPPFPDPTALPEPVAILVPAGQLVALEPPLITSWFEQAVLPVGGFLLIHGWIKSFKSFAGFDMMAALAQGQPWAHLEPTEEPCRTAVIQYEIPWPFYQQRVQALRAAAEDVELFDQNYLTYDPMRRPQLIAGNKKQEEKVMKDLLDAEVQVVLVDPVRRIAGSADLNSEQDVRKVLGFYERLQDEGLTVVSTHHDRKSSAGRGDVEGMTGSGAFGGDPDTVVSIELPRGDDFRTSTRRNLRFLMRNGPSVGGRGMVIGEEGRISYTADAFNDDSGEDDDDAPAI